MESKKRIVRLIFGLGLLTIAAMALSALALQDIFHGLEPNLNLEWKMVRVSYLLNLMFIALSLGYVWRGGRP